MRDIRYPMREEREGVIFSLFLFFHEAEKCFHFTHLQLVKKKEKGKG